MNHINQTDIFEKYQDILVEKEKGTDYTIGTVAYNIILKAPALLTFNMLKMTFVQIHNLVSLIPLVAWSILTNIALILTTPLFAIFEEFINYEFNFKVIPICVFNEITYAKSPLLVGHLTDDFEVRLDEKDKELEKKMDSLFPVSPELKSYVKDIVCPLDQRVKKVLIDQRLQEIPTLETEDIRQMINSVYFDVYPDHNEMDRQIFEDSLQRLLIWAEEKEIPNSSAPLESPERNTIASIAKHTAKAPSLFVWNVIKLSMVTVYNVISAIYTVALYAAVVAAYALAAIPMAIYETCHDFEFSTELHCYAPKLFDENVKKFTLPFLFETLFWTKQDVAIEA